MMLRQRLAIAAATPNLIPMPTAHAPLDRSTRQIAVRPEVRPLENRRSHASNPHRAQRRNRAPAGPRFRALALLGRLSWERVDGFVMQASEKPVQLQTSRQRPGDKKQADKRQGTETNFTAPCRSASAAAAVRDDPSCIERGSARGFL